jgi:hypothetical protein
MVSLRDGCRFEVSSVKQERAGRMPEAKGAKRTQFRPGGVPDGANRAKRTQTWGTWGISASAGVVWASARPGSKTCKTNPIWSGRGGCRRRKAQNEPNLARVPGNGRGLAGRDARPEGDCAKRTQFEPSGGACRRRNARNEPNFAPAGCQTEQIVRNEPNFEVSSFQFEVSSVGSERAHAPCSDFKPQTSHFKLPARRPRGRDYVQNEPNLAPPARLTEQIVQNEAKLAGTRVYGQGKPSCGELRLDVKCAKRTQFAAGGADACGPSTRRTGTRRTGEGVRCTPYGAYCTSPAKETSGRGGFPGPAESVSLRGIRVKRDRVNPHESVSYLRFSAAVPAQASSTSL